MSESRSLLQRIVDTRCAEYDNHFSVEFSQDVLPMFDKGCYAVLDTKANVFLQLILLYTHLTPGSIEGAIDIFLFQLSLFSRR